VTEEAAVVAEMEVVEVGVGIFCQEVLLLLKYLSGNIMVAERYFRILHIPHVAKKDRTQVKQGVKHRGRGRREPAMKVVSPLKGANWPGTLLGACRCTAGKGAFRSRV
jgi:hypothetical protein